MKYHRLWMSFTKPIFCSSVVVLFCAGRCLGQVDLIQSAQNPKDLFAPDPPYAQISPECQQAKAFLRQRRIPSATLDKISCADAIKIAGQIAAQEYAREEKMRAEHTAESTESVGDTARDIAKQIIERKPDPLSVFLNTYFADVEKVPAQEEKQPYSDLRTGPFPSAPKQEIPWPKPSFPKLIPWSDGPAFTAPSPLQNYSGGSSK
jgi:hypothetical protein